MAAQQIGIVTTVIGQVVAVNADGVERVLVVGDVVYADEVIRTADAGAVTIQFNDGGWFDLGGNAQAVLDSDVYSQEAPDAQAAEAVASVEDIQAAILAGGDPTQLLPPTAAGAAAAGGAGGEGGHSFVALDHDFNFVNPEAGIPTAADPLLFSGVERVIVPEEPQPPAPPPPPVDNPVAISGLTPASEGGDVSVNEAHLADGTDPNAPALTQAGTFTISAPDGLGSLTINGVVVLNSAGLTGNTVTTPLGNTLVVTGYDAASGVVSYQYTLLDNEAHPLAQGTNNLFENLPVVLTDSDGDTVGDVLSVRIIDDVPNATSDIDEVVTGASTGGNVITGADDDAVDVVLADVPGADRAVPVTGVAAGASLGSPITDGAGVGAAVDGLHGKLVLNADGSYTYSANSGITTNVQDVFTYTITDADGDTSTATLTIQVAGEAPPPPPPPPPPTINVGNPETGLGDIVVPEGTDAIFGVVITGAAAGSKLSLTLAPSGANAATEGSDYKATTFQYSLDGGSTWTTITEGTAFGINSGNSTVLVKTDTVADRIDEPNETFTLTGTLTSNGTPPLSDSGIATILDNDAGPTFSINDVTVTEGTDPTITFTVTKSGLTALATSVDYAVAPGTAVTPGDYTAGLSALAGTLTFAAGETSKTITLNVTDDTVAELTETFNVNLSGATNATIADNQGVGTILDNDAVLVVGSNANDQGASNTPHTVPSVFPPGQGAINGVGGNDILIGDIGGSALTGAKGNFAFVLDSSGSMDTQITFNGTTITRMQALKNGVNTALDALANSGASDVRVHLTDFDSSASNLGTFDLVVNGVIQTSALAAAHAAVNSMSDAGRTNYEAGLQEALNWINGAQTVDPIANAAVNQVIFVSDGAPNRVLQGNSTNFNDGTDVDSSAAYQSILGTYNPWFTSNDDTVSEVALIETDNDGGGVEQAFTIQAIGIALSGAALTDLGQVEGAGGAATSVNTSEQLADALNPLQSSLTLAAAGADVINGGDGNDLIFGDAPNTDALANAQGLANPDGAGWQVFADLEAPGGVDWSRADTLAYLNNPANHATLAQESLDSDGSGRTGGNDIINGGAGNDVIFGQEGNDIITGGAGADTLSGGSGSDTFVFQSSALGTGVDNITDFNIAHPASGGDVLDISDLLTGAGISETQFNTAPSDYLVVTSGTNTTIAFDANGGDHADAVQIATLQNVNTSLATLISNGQIDHTA